MAIATAYQAINMAAWMPFETDRVTGFTTNTIRHVGVTDELARYFGTNGSVTSADLRINDVLQYEISGLTGISKAQVLDYVYDENYSGLLAYLFDGKDTINGSDFADVINGYGGNDLIDGKGGADLIVGGSGADTMIWSPSDRFNGGSGTDSLRISTQDQGLDLTNVAKNRISNVETVDLRGAGSNTLKLNLQDILDLSSSTNTLNVLGTASDTVNIVGAQSGPFASAGGFSRYTIGAATLLIDSDITVM